MVIYLNKKKKLRIVLPWEKETVQKWLMRSIVAVAFVSVVLFAVAISFYAKVERLKLEAGSDLTPYDIVKREDAEFVGFEAEYLRRPGVYYFTVVYDGGERDVRLCVVDTKAPEVKVRSVKCAVGGAFPEAFEFIGEVKEADECIAEYVESFPEIDRMGVYYAKVVFRDPSGNKTKPYEVEMTIISDNQGPDIVLSREKIEIYVGEKPDYLQFASASDNCTGKVTVKYDDSGVNYEKKGAYKVIYTATDAVGNKSQATIKVFVSEKPDDEG